MPKESSQVEFSMENPISKLNCSSLGHFSTCFSFSWIHQLKLNLTLISLLREFINNLINLIMKLNQF